MTRRDWLLMSALFAGTLASRIPFRTTLLYAWDSVLYTRAIDHFDVTIHQPQPPGHIFYVGLVWIVNRLLADPNASMVWISAFMAAGAVAALYWLGKTMLNRRIGALAALLLATSTSFWAYSEVAYPYTLLCLLSILGAFSIYQLWEGRTAWVIPAALTLGIAGGFRSDLLLFLMPLMLAGLFRMGWWRILAAAAILMVTTAAWYIPAALLSGGFTAYRVASAEQSDYLITYFSVFGKGWEALGSNIRMLLRFNLYGLAAALPLTGLLIGGLPGKTLRPLLADRRFWFLVIWLVPSLAFYVFIHVGEYGYIFTYLPALLLAGAWGLEPITRGSGRNENKAERLFAISGGILVALNLVLFIFLSTPLSAGRLAARDDILRCRLGTIQERFDPTSTLVVSVFDYEIASYYLPRFSHWRFDQAVETHPTLETSPGVRNVVVFEEFLKPEDASASGEIGICRDQRLYFLPINGPSKIRVDWDRRKIGLDGAS